MNGVVIADHPDCKQKVEVSLVNWGSDDGKLLDESNAKVDFYKLANHFESQSNKVFCGPASAAIVLNALRVRTGVKITPDETLLSSEDRKHLARDPLYERYTQNSVFTVSPKPRRLVLGAPIVDNHGKALLDDNGKPKRDYGFQIRQFADLLRAHGLRVKLQVVSNDADVNKLKAELVRNLMTKNDYVIVNYARSTLGQPGGGHISPVAAYHHGTDRFLIMDVTPNKADWVWVKADLLMSAMNTFDTKENRGYVLVSEKLSATPGR